MVAGAAVTVVGGTSGAKMMVPPPVPGPVPSAPAISVKPTVSPRLSVGMVVPLVRVTAASMWTSCPAQSAMLPSVVTRAWNTRTSRPALNSMLPLLVVRAALTITSRPQHATMLPLVAVIGALMLTSQNAFIVSVVGTPAADQATASLMKMSPLPTVALPGSGIVLITMLLFTSSAESVAPEMLPPAPTVKSAGSISQVPV